MKPAACVSLLVLVAASTSAGTDENSNSTKGGSKQCAGHYYGGVVNLCEEHWPDENAEKIWFVVFYTPWCGHCRALEPKFLKLAKALKYEEPGIGLGAVDCNEIRNQDLCADYDVRGYPTLKAIIAGKAKPYHGAREYRQMENWILNEKSSKGTKGGSKKCPLGVFRNRKDDAVVPLCEAHFPQNNAKHAWMVIAYNQNDETDIRDGVNLAATELGNEPPEKDKGRKQEPKRKRDRLLELEDTYSLSSLELPSKGPFGNETLAKVGGLCCDCTDENQEFCNGILGDRKDDPLPLKLWIDKGERNIFDGRALDTQSLIEFTLQQLGFLPKPNSDELEL